jgi:hypothetical protein
MLKMGFEEIRDVFKPDMALRKIAELLEVPAGVVATEADAAQARKARLAMQQRMAEAQAAKDESAAAANVAKARQANGEQLPPAAAGALPIAPQPALSPAGQVV